MSSAVLRTVRSRPSASSVPITVEIAVTSRATVALVRSEARTSSLRRSSPYQVVENPPHDVGSPEALKDRTTSTRIGAYRNT